MEMNNVSLLNDFTLATFIVLLVVMFVPSVKAEQTVKTIEIPIGFISQTIADNDYIITKTIQSPDGISDILFLEIMITGDFQANTEIKARVRKTGTQQIFDCEPSSWTTPNLNTPNYKTSFDCSDLINQFDFTTGQIDIGFRGDKISQNVKADFKITYYNNPKVSMSFFGTEYQVGDEGTSFIQLLDNDRQAINDASCYIDAYYPNKSVMWNNAYLNYQESSDGLYYKDFTATNTIGLYMLSSVCYIPSIAWIDEFNDYSLMSDYENITVSGGIAQLSYGYPEVNYQIFNISGDVDVQKNTPDVNYAYSSTMQYQNHGSQTSRIYTSWDISNYIGSSSINSALLCMYMLTDGSTDNVSLYEVYNAFWNETTVTWNTQPCGINFDNVSACNNATAIINTNSTGVGWHCWNITSFFQEKIDENNDSLSIVFKTPEDASKNLDNFYTSRETNSSLHPYLNVTYDLSLINTTNGYIYSEEINLVNNSNGWQSFNASYSSGSGNISFYIVNSTNDTICTGLGNIETCADTYSPIRLYAKLNRTENVTSPYIDSWSISWFINGTIREVKGAGELHISNYVSNLENKLNNISVNIDEVADEVWQYNNTINPNIISQFSNAIWTLFNSTYNFVSLITENVWTRADRNLTYYEDKTNYEQIQEMIWNATNRSLTSFNFDVVNETEVAIFVWENFERNLTSFEFDVVNESEVASAVWNYQGTISDNILTQVANRISCILNRIFYNEEGWGIDIPVC